MVAEDAKFAGDVDRWHGAPVLREMDKNEFGQVRLNGVGQILAHEAERRTGLETRYVVLGHIQLAGLPSAFDRVLASGLRHRRYRHGAPLPIRLHTHLARERDRSGAEAINKNQLVERH